MNTLQECYEQDGFVGESKDFVLIPQVAAKPLHDYTAAAIVHMTPVEEKECTCTYTAGGPSLDNDCPYHKDKKPK